MIKVYRKTGTIKAEQFDGSNEMVERYDMGFQLAPNGKGGVIIKTLEGDLLVHVGDWIATGTNGEHWSIADDAFKKTYAELPVIPYYVNDYINHMKLSYRDIWDAMHYPFRSDKIDKYMEDNSETFARAWLDGYQVEEDK
ncbi:DUF1642 domain-containing protein [Lactiplantibacillus plantarum]|uniref:DUF1642 domain-containing protein n=1 Tax=Lactiplantibacillus plantarum TaxID=1590 RepID=UPI0022408EC3|nr:DUF1642 domain-containing protein [Lactiplantibacillus plantarum]